MYGQISFDYFDDVRRFLMQIKRQEDLLFAGNSNRHLKEAWLKIRREMVVQALCSVNQYDQRYVLTYMDLQALYKEDLVRNAELAQPLRRRYPCLGLMEVADLMKGMKQK